MPKKKKLFVIPDTNVLFTPSIKSIVSGAFELSWKSILERSDAELCIPELTIKELTYQRYLIATASLENAKKNFDNIDGVSGIAMPQLPDEATLRKGIVERLDRWVQSTSAKILNVPHNSIDWHQLIDDAVWRIAPFEAGKTEKGFRDRIILETVATFCAENTAGPIAFVSGDNQLCSAAENRLPDENQTQIFESIEKLASEIELLAQNLEKEFVTSILNDVENVFFMLNAKDTVFSMFDLKAKITNEFPKELQASLQFYLTSPSHVIWNPISPEESVYVGETSFISREGGNKYRWKTELLFRRYFTPDPYTKRIALYPIADKIREAKFDVFWDCRISPDTKFTDLQLDHIEPGDVRLLQPGTLEAALSHGRPAFRPRTLAEIVSSAPQGADATGSYFSYLNNVYQSLSGTPPSGSSSS